MGETQALKGRAASKRKNAAVEPEMSANATDNADKAPRTARGRLTLRKLLDAAAAEFGDKGFYDALISGITRRAGTALGTFYTYFDSKEAIFIELVRDISGRVSQEAAASMVEDRQALLRERHALTSFLRFARTNKEIYRIIDQAEFVDAAVWRSHYERHAQNIAGRLARGVEDGELRPGDAEVRAWAIMGMNVFLGLRYGVWDEECEADAIADTIGDLLERGLGRPA